MKKLILIAFFLLSFFSINAQTTFFEYTYYTQKYNINSQRYDLNSYYEVINDQRSDYELWKTAVWYQYTGFATYYKWQYSSNLGYYQWFQYSGNGTFYYFKMVIVKVYFYYYNGRKYYL